MKIEKNEFRGISLSEIEAYGKEELYLNGQELNQLMVFLADGGFVTKNNDEEIKKLQDVIHGFEQTIKTLREDHFNEIKAIQRRLNDSNYLDLKIAMRVMDRLVNSSPLMTLSPKIQD